MMKTITIKEETWRRLMRLKMYSSQTFDAIINNLIDLKEGLRQKEAKTK